MIICHMAALKEGEKPNKCLTCNKSFSSYYCLRKHGKQCGTLEDEHVHCNGEELTWPKNEHGKTLHT